MATKKSGGTSKNGRKSAGKRLGVKLSDGQAVKAGGIIVRQKGTKFYAADNVKIGRDHTIFSICEGKVKFSRGKKNKVFVGVEQAQ